MFPLIKGIMAAKDMIGSFKDQGNEGGFSEIEQSFIDQGTPLQSPSFTAGNGMIDPSAPQQSEMDEILMNQQSGYDPNAMGMQQPQMGGMDKFQEVMKAFMGGMG